MENERSLTVAARYEEAARLQGDLRRAGVEPYGWVVNSSLAASCVSRPLLASRARLELTRLYRVRELSGRRWVLPWQESPAGREGLAALFVKAGAPAGGR